MTEACCPLHPGASVRVETKAGERGASGLDWAGQGEESGTRDSPPAAKRVCRPSTEEPSQAFGDFSEPSPPAEAGPSADFGDFSEPAAAAAEDMASTEDLSKAKEEYYKELGEALVLFEEVKDAVNKEEGESGVANIASTDVPGDSAHIWERLLEFLGLKQQHQAALPHMNDPEELAAAVPPGLAHLYGEQDPPWQDVDEVLSSWWGSLPADPAQTKADPPQTTKDGKTKSKSKTKKDFTPQEHLIMFQVWVKGAVSWEKHLEELKNNKIPLQEGECGVCGKQGQKRDTMRQDPLVKKREQLVCSACYKHHRIYKKTRPAYLMLQNVYGKCSKDEHGVLQLSPFLKDAQKQLPYRTAEDLKTLWAKICKREDSLKMNYGMDLRRFFMFFHAQDGKCASDPSTDLPHPFDSSGVGIQVDHYGLCDEGIPREEWTQHARLQRVRGLESAEKNRDLITADSDLGGGLGEEGYVPPDLWRAVTNALARTLHAATQNCMVYYRLKNTGCFRNAADNEAALE